MNADSIVLRNFFSSIISNVNYTGKLQFVLLTHVLPDICDFISILEQLGTISVIIAIPYSLDSQAYSKLSLRHKILTPSLKDLLTHDTLLKIVENNSPSDMPTILLEIGGYFAPILSNIERHFGKNLLGVIEDTEAGHRKYESCDNKLPCPVISVARSQLKFVEDLLVGNSCLFATKTIFQKSALTLTEKKVLVMGYGKIGGSVAHALKKSHNQIMLYDMNPIKRLHALAEGFYIPEKVSALKSAEIIFGATGTNSITQSDMEFVRNDCILISCSSKQVEFDMDFIKSNYKEVKVNDVLSEYTKNQQKIYVIGDGQPINFVSEKIMVGSLISLVQGVMLLGVRYLLTKQKPNNLLGVEPNEEIGLANSWIDCFCDSHSGHFNHV